ncbi:MAG: hypothetical protein JWN04_2406 [Myxococcaceae bacterium]|nr:hypothetical protein [Myxococcaceae bacterium]
MTNKGRPTAGPWSRREIRRKVNAWTHAHIAQTVEHFRRQISPWIALVMHATAACSSSSGAESSKGSCAPPSDIAALDLGCIPSAPPVLKTVGPCTVASGESAQTLYLQSTDAGVCHIEVTFETGVTSTVDVSFVARWRALGDDPHGCGQEFVAVTDAGSACSPSACQFSVPEACDGGV